MTGRIFDIQRFSIHDGPGIRTTVFLKGCPLRCVWCHNPEAVSRERHLSYVASSCVLCGACVQACEHGVHHVGPDGHALTRAGCVVCGGCAEACPAAALELVGRDATVAEVLATVMRDKPFYDTSGGGLTISGGEPLAQLEFTAALLESARAEGLHTAIETCSQAPWERFVRVLPLVDLFLCDLKETDPARHEAYTGADPTRIRANLAALHAAGATMRVRLPLVPGLNDRDDHFDAVAELARALPRAEGFELMPYHRLGTAKRERMGLPPESELMAGIEAPSLATVAEWVEALRRRGVRVLNEV